MNVAKCTLDGQEYTADNFAKLSAKDIAKKRFALICVECLQPAFFTKASRNGRGASFGARPHIDGCKLASQESEEVEGALFEFDPRINDGREVDLDLNPTGRPIVHVDGTATPARGGRARGRQSTGTGTPGKAKSKRTLRGLLRELRASSALESSRQIIDLKGYGKHPFCDVLKRLSSTTVVTGSPYLFWGEITHIKEQPHGIFLNGTMLGLRLDTVDKLEVMRRNRLSSSDEFKGKHVIALATCAGNWGANVTDLSHIALL